MRKISTVVQEAIAAGIARFSSNGLSLIGPSGAKFRLRDSNSIVFLGDSITRNAWSSNNGATLVRDATGTLVTVTLTGHPFMSGQYALLEQFADSSFNGFVQVTRTGANTFIYQQTGTPNSTTSGGGVCNPYQTTDNGFVTWLKILLGNRLQVLFNAGIGGNTSAQVLARVQRDVIAYAPATCSEMCGVNDVTAGATAAAIFTNRQAIWAQLLAAGIRVVAHTVLPLEYSYSGLSNAVIDGYNEVIRQLNAMVRAACTGSGMVLCDSASVVVDSLSATGQPLTGYLATDHIHPAPIACKAIAVLLASILSPIIPKFNTLPSSAADNRASSAANKNLWRSLPSTTSGGTAVISPVVGTTAAQFAVTSTGNAGRTCVASVVARTVAADGDDIGYNQRGVLTAAAAGDTMTITQGSSGWAASGVIGKAYYFEFAINVTGVAGSNLTSLLIKLAYVVDGVTYNAYVLMPSGGTFPNTDFQGVVQTVPFFLTGSTYTNMVIGVTATCGAAGSAVAVDVGRADVMELDAGSTLTY